MDRRKKGKKERREGLTGTLGNRNRMDWEVGGMGP